MIEEARAAAIRKRARAARRDARPRARTPTRSSRSSPRSSAAFECWKRRYDLDGHARRRRGGPALRGGGRAVSHHPGGRGQRRAPRHGRPGDGVPRRPRARRLRVADDGRGLRRGRPARPVRARATSAWRRCASARRCSTASCRSRAPRSGTTVTRYGAAAPAAVAAAGALTGETPHGDPVQVRHARERLEVLGRAAGEQVHVHPGVVVGQLPAAAVAPAVRQRHRARRHLVGDRDRHLHRAGLRLEARRAAVLEPVRRGVVGVHPQRLHAVAAHQQRRVVHPRVV